MHKEVGKLTYKEAEEIARHFGECHMGREGEVCLFISKAKRVKA